MPSSRRSRLTKASWLALGIITFAALACVAQEHNTDTEERNNAQEADSQLVFEDGAVTAQNDLALEADRAYNRALAAFDSILTSPEPKLQDEEFGLSSLLSFLLPSLEGHGPFSSALRIVAKLSRKSWIPEFITSLFRGDFGNTNTDEKAYVEAAKVTLLLRHAASLGHMDALFTLAAISLFPPSHHFPNDPQTAFESLSTHAAVTGNASSQSFLGFFYSTGYQGVTPVDQAKAQLYYTFGASGGSRGAQMALGYRYWTGIGVLEDCNRAVEWYERAAEQSMEIFNEGPPGGMTLPPPGLRLSDLDGGIYGPGASVASTGLSSQRSVIKAANSRAAGETWEDVLEYYLFNADRGEVGFAYRLGKIYYQGSLYAAPGGIASGAEGVGRVPRDYRRALHYFLQIARQTWPTDPLDYKHRPMNKEETGPVGYSAPSAGYIGRMYLRAEGVEANPVIAKMWFDRGAEYDDRESHNGLGLIYRDGLLDGRKDLKKALHHFGLAATQELAEAQVNMGKYHYERGEIKPAMSYFESAVRNGSPFEAYYYLAQIQARTMRSPGLPEHISAGACGVAVSFYKLVAERGVWDVDFLKVADEQWNSGTERGRSIAMLQWWISAERGMEAAQNNLAYVLDQDKSILRFTRFSPTSPSNDTARLALTQWTRSASQNNVDALVKVGDYFYHGFGVPDEPESVRWEKAAGYYQSAADTQVSALAMWNLGWMYENGVGVAQDFHLAKRHYDLALETNGEAYLPVTISLIKLHIRKFWHTRILRDHSPTPEVTQTRDSHSIEGAPAEKKAEPASQKEIYEDYDDSWFLGKAREEAKKRQKRPETNKDEDAVQWARDRRNEHDREIDFGPEDYFDGTLRPANLGEEDIDEFAETMLLIGLCLLVSGLFYLRRRWVERLQREREEQLRQQQPPPPADQWAALG